MLILFIPEDIQKLIQKLIKITLFPFYSEDHQRNTSAKYLPFNLSNNYDLYSRLSKIKKKIKIIYLL